FSPILRTDGVMLKQGVARQAKRCYLNHSIGNQCQRGCARASEWVWHDLGESSSFRWKKQESLYSKKSICRLFNSPRICFVTTGINPQHTIHRPRKKNDLAVLLVLSNFPNARVPRLCYW